MLRRVSASVTAVGVVASACARAYRIVPHIDYEIEELGETQKLGRWQVSHKNCLQQPLKRGEIMCEKLNLREKRRSGILPEKSIARKLSQVYAKNGEVCEPHYQTKMINITIVGFDGHPFVFRLYPMPECNLNTLIDGSGMCHGHANMWTKCSNADCQDWYHGDGCLVNVDLETLDRLPPPNRWEYQALAQWRSTDRPDVTVTSRFSCQIPLTEELDGALFAVKQFWTRSLREGATNWGLVDDYATIASLRSKRIEPWAPLIEEPTKQDFAVTFDMLWAQSYQDILQATDPKYRRKDGFHTRPSQWSTFV